MNHQRIIFESSPAYLFVCFALALGLAFLMYRMKHPWPKIWNTILLVARTVLFFSLMFLLLGPIVRQINNFLEKPLFVVLFDNSASVREATDSLTLQTLQVEMQGADELLTKNGYDVKRNDLAGNEIDRVDFNAPSTDLTGALKKIANRYEGRKISGVLLISDGIYNSGTSPLFANYNFPVHTIGLGDTLQRVDVGIKNVAYNKIAYEGNKFPVRVEVTVRNLPNERIGVSLLQRGKVIEQQTKTSKGDVLLVYDFQPLASEQGMQKFDIQVDVKPGETNSRNNRASIFVEVVEGKKKILVVASAPHPDIKAIREVVEKNSNYEFLLHIPGTAELPATALRAEQIDLAILYQVPDTRGRTRDLFQKFITSKTSLLLVLGQQSDLRLMAQQNLPIKFESIPRDYDEVTPVANPNFGSFSISAEANTIMADYPPVSVHFGKVRIPLTATPLLFQRVGNISTEKPLLAVDFVDGRKIGIMLGEGFWRWRLNEFDRTENSLAFDEVFGKLIQYLSTTEDKRKFRSYPIQHEFADVEPVVFESQVYNDLFEPVFGNTIEIDITDDTGKRSSYSYITSPGNIRYSIGGLKEGVYRYRSKTVINQKQEEVRGEFAVLAKEAELQNLTADFDLLKKLSANTGGRFYKATQTEKLKADFQNAEAKSIIHSEESYNSLINIKLVFWLTLALITMEWFARKFFGSY